MNKIHRIVWSESRGAFIVAHENAATSGKRSSTKTVIAKSLAVAALFAAAAPALAQTVTLTTLMPSVTNTGTIQGTTGGPGVAVFGVKAGSITNSGTIAGSTAAGESNVLYGVYVGTSGGLSGGVTNSGLITGPNGGINIVSTSTVANILNTGVIAGASNAGILASGGSVGTITNSGTGSQIIGGSDGIKLTGGVSASGIVNAGTISGGTADGVWVSGAGSTLSSISNSGLITGGTYGVSVENSGAIGSISNLATISGAQAGINVGTGGSISSITNGSTGVITATNGNGNGIQVGNATIGSIFNAGSITGGTANGIGILVKTGGTIGSISNSGLIYGQNYGINVAGTGATVTSITNSGRINANYSAIGIYQGAHVGSIVNSGSITAGTSSDGISVANASVGNISNSGLISGGYSGIQAQSATISSLVNSGTITGSQTYGYGALLQDGSSVTGGITNSGLISGGRYGVLLESTSTVAGGITNTGTISGAQNAGLALFENGTVLGGITNSGKIIGGETGVILDTNSLVAGGINNSGTISGGFAGVLLETTSTVTGGITNSGLISGAQFGVLVESASTIAGGITNSGTISGGIGMEVESGSTIAGGITNSGKISGANVGLLVEDGSAVVGDISNSGTISGAFNGIQIQDSTVTGALVNRGVITTIVGGSNSGAAVSLTNAVLGSIQNSGTISSQGSGILDSQSTVSSIQNSGTIAGGGAGLYVAFGSAVSSGITNSGLIKGTAYSGVLLAGAQVTGGLHNAAGGVISGASGLSLYASSIDNIVNDAGASIIGTGFAAQPSSTELAGLGLRAQSVITGSVVNAGVIQGSGYGISIIGFAPTTGFAGTPGGTIVGGVTNSGTIAGGIDGIYVAAGGVLGNLTNLAGGVISGGTTAGILLATGATATSGITNAGTITGGVAGVQLTGSTLTGALVNSGNIAGGVTGVAVTATSAITGGLANSGTISGSKYALNVDATSTIGPITISGNNTAAFVGDVLALNSPVTVASGTFTGTNAFNVQSFDVAQGATLNMGVMASTAGEANGITVSNGVTNEGTLSVARNTANINGAYTQAASGALGVSVVSNTNHGVLAISGAANLSPAANIIVDIASNNTLTNKETIAGVLTSGALTASTFNVTDNSELIAFKGLVDGNNVDLVTSFNALVLPDVLANKNVNAVGAATALDQIILSSGGGNTTFDGIINDIVKLQTTRQVSNAASQTLPVLSGDVTVATYAAMSQMNQVVQSRVAGNYGMSAGSPYTLDQNAWVKPFGSWANAGNQNGAPGFTSNVEGVALGGDAAISNAARVGLAFAYGNVDVSGNASAAPNNDRINMYQLMGYGSYAIDPQTEVNAQIDGGINSNDGHRNIEFAGTNATSSFNSSDAHIGVGIARSLPLSDATVFTPEVRVDYTWISTDDYSEGGAGPLSLNTKSTSFESLLTSINGKLTQKFNDNLTLFGNFGFGYDSMAHTNTSVVAAFSGAPGLSFSTQGIGLSPRAILGGIGMVSTAHGNMPELTFRYDLQQREGFADQSLSFKARWAF